MEVNQEPLFKVERTVATACPVPHCQAIRLPNQQRVISCAHDLDPERKTRPRHCLNRVDPATSEIPY